MDEFGVELKCANGSSISYSGYIFANVETEFTQKPIETVLLVVPVQEYHGTAHVLLGKNVLREMKPWAGNTTVNEIWKAGFMSVNAEMGLVTATKPITLHPGESRTVTGFYRKQGLATEAVTETVEDIPCHSAIVCPRVVSIDNPGKTARTPVRICNVTARPINIKAKQTLCQLNEVKVLREAPICQPVCANINHVDAPETENKRQHENRKEKYGIDLDDSELTTDQKTEVYNLFEKWQSIFPTSDLDLGHTKTVKHKINLINEEPFKEPYRRIPPSLFNEVREHLKDMLDVGAIRESNSPWSSNCVIVRKKDDSIRFCIDFRRLNK